MKQTSNVGMALWSLVIAFDTFWLLFYRKMVPNLVFYIVTILVWAFLVFIIFLGCLIIATPETGPFYGISGDGLYCWIASNNLTEKYMLDYLFRFITVLFSFILYSLTFFRLRGNIVTNGWRISFQRRIVPNQPGNHIPNVVMNPSQNTLVMRVARRMMWYPITYAILVMPITVTHMAVPSDVTAIAITDTIFMLSGCVDVILFTTTRRVLPAINIFPSFIRTMFGISAGTGMNTHQLSSPNPATSTHMSEAAGTDVIDISVSTENGMAGEYASTVPTSGGAHMMSELPSHSFDPVTPFNHLPLGYPTVHGRGVVWPDWAMSPSNGRGGSGTCSFSSDTSIVMPRENNIPIALQYPSSPNQPHLSPHSISNNIDIYRNPRDRGDRSRSGVYAYGDGQYTASQVDYDTNIGRGV